MNIKVLALLMMATSTLLSGCMSIPVTTMYKVSQLSILSLNPDEIQVAVLTNEAENFPPFNHEYEFKPQEQVLSASASNIPAILKDDIEDNEKITILTFYDKDAATMKDVLAQVKRYREKARKYLVNFPLASRVVALAIFTNLMNLKLICFCKQKKTMASCCFSKISTLLKKRENTTLKIIPKGNATQINLSHYQELLNGSAEMLFHINTEISRPGLPPFYQMYRLRSAATPSATKAAINATPRYS